MLNVQREQFDPMSKAFLVDMERRAAGSASRDRVRAPAVAGSISGGYPDHAKQPCRTGDDCRAIDAIALFRRLAFGLDAASGVAGGDVRRGAAVLSGLRGTDSTGRDPVRSAQWRRQGWNAIRPTRAGYAARRPRHRNAFALGNAGAGLGHDGISRGVGSASAKNSR